MFILKTTCGKVYTGRAGEGWVSADQAEAFELSQAEAERKVKRFNSLSGLHGLTFNVVEA